MAKPDYKQSPRAEKPPASPLMPFTTGLFSGVFLSFLGYLYFTQSTPSIAHYASQSPPVVATIAPKNPVKPPKPVDKTTFEFYTILEEQEGRIAAIDRVATPHRPVKPRVTPTAHRPKIKGYVLQLGSFKKSAEAESLRAELLLNNYFNTRVESVIHQQQRWHRVQIGPYAQRQQVEQAKAKLKRFTPVIKEIRG